MYTRIDQSHSLSGGKTPVVHPNEWTWYGEGFEQFSVGGVGSILGSCGTSIAALNCSEVFRQNSGHHELWWK